MTMGQCSVATSLPFLPAQGWFLTMVRRRDGGVETYSNDAVQSLDEAIAEVNDIHERNENAWLGVPGIGSRSEYFCTIHIQPNGELERLNLTEQAELQSRAARIDAHNELRHVLLEIARLGVL